jgi:hypothetical protein
VEGGESPSGNPGWYMSLPCLLLEPQAPHLETSVSISPVPRGWQAITLKNCLMCVVPAKLSCCQSSLLPESIVLCDDYFKSERVLGVSRPLMFSDVHFIYCQSRCLITDYCSEW